MEATNPQDTDAATHEFESPFADKQGKETLVYCKRLVNSISVTFAASWLVSCAIVGGGTDIERARGYSVTPPQSWERAQSGESDKAYRLPSGNIVTLVSSCHRNPDAPLDVLTRHLLIGTRDVKTVKRTKTRFGSNEGLHSLVTAKLEGKPFELELFVLAKKDCVFDFTLVSPTRISESDSKSFKDYIGSFEYGKN